MFPESHGFVMMSVTGCIKETSSNLSLSNWWMETKLYELVTGTVTKPWLWGFFFFKYKNMRKWRVEFSGRGPRGASNRSTGPCGQSYQREPCESRSSKIVRVNSIRITISTNLLSFCSVLRVSCDVEILKLIAFAQSIYRKGYVMCNIV